MPLIYIIFFLICNDAEFSEKVVLVCVGSFVNDFLGFLAVDAGRVVHQQG